MNQAVDRNLARRWFRAVMGGNIDMIRQLVIQNPGIVNIYSRDGTALTIACQQFSNLDALNNRYYDIIDFLLGAGANPNLPNDEDMLPIMILLNGIENAERREMQMYDDVFELLKEHGMNVNAFTEQGETALMFACNSNAMRSVRYLVENLGADVNAEQRPYATALLYATNTGSVEMVEYLIQHGAVPNRIITHFVQSGEFDNKPAMKELLLRASAAAAAAAARPAPAAAAAPVEEEEKMDPEEKTRRNQWFAAVKEGKKKNIQNMIKNDINVNMTNDKGNTALIYAILQEKYEIANLLLINGKDPNIAIPQAGKTPLMLALLMLSKTNTSKGSGGLSLLIGNLIKLSNLDTQDVNGDTALHYAVQLNQEKIVQMLLNKGADPNVKNTFGNTPLMMICTHKDTGSQEDKILDHLLKDPRTDKTTTRSNDGTTPLMYAIMSNNIKFVTKLLRAGLDPNIISNESLSPLMMSIDKDPKIIEALLRVRDINVNQKGPGGDTALFMAIRSKKVGIARLLLEHGADPTIGTDNGEVPLEYVISHRDYPNKILLIELMLQHGADPNTISRNTNNSLLLGAVLNNNIPLVNLLLRYGADVNQSNPAGLTPLMGAAHIGSVQLITLLLKAGADANAKTKNGLSALIYAMANKNNPNRFEVVSALLEADPPIRINDLLQKKYTALLTATQYDLTDVMLLLLTAGANPNYRTDIGTSALDMAIAGNNMEQINMLIDHGAKPTAIIQDMVDERKINNPAILELLRERFHMVPRMEAWSGWSQSDIDHFDSVFLKDVAPEKEKEAIRERNNNIVCPICLRYVSRESGCMYMYHNCKDMGGFYHKELYDKYKGPNGIITFCTICGRICGGDHQHYELADPDADVPELYPKGGDPFDNDCSRTNFGGGPIEKAARFMAMRSVANALNSEVGKMSKREALNTIVQASWIAAKSISTVPPVDAVKDAIRQGRPRNQIPPTYAGNPELREEIIDQLKKGKYDLPIEDFPIASQLRQQIEENRNRINVERREPNFSNPELRPIVHRYGFNAVMQSNVNENDYDSKEEEDKLIQFRHRNKKGEINLHENQFIDRDVLINRLSSLLPVFYTEEQAGYCPIPGCGGLLYPEEIRGLVPDDIYQAYRIKFNNKFRDLAGGARKNKNNNKHYKNRMNQGNRTSLPFFEPITNAACAVKRRNNATKKGGRRMNKRRATKRRGMIMYPKKGKRVLPKHTKKNQKARQKARTRRS